MAAIAEEIIDSAEGLVRCCAYLATQPVIGMDTEFVGEETYHPNLCLVQVATPDRLILIDPFEAGPLDEFWKLLLDPARVVVVHAGREVCGCAARASARCPRTCSTCKSPPASSA